MEILKIFLLILVSAALLSAQIVIEEVGVGSDSTRNRTVTVGSDSLVGQKSPWGAAFLSLTLPGAGQLYLEQHSKAAAYLSADLVLLAGSLFSEATSRRIFKNAINFARINAHTESTRDWRDDYWKDVGFGDSTFLSSQKWNEEWLKGREFDELYTGSDEWSWDSNVLKNEYNDQRSRSSRWHTASFTFLGGMVVNRVVSFIDARVSANRYNSRLFSSVQVTPYYSLADGSGAIYFTGSFGR